MPHCHCIGDADLFLDHFVSSLYDEYLTSGFHIKLENINVGKLNSQLYNRLKIKKIHIMNPYHPIEGLKVWILLG